MRGSAKGHVVIANAGLEFAGRGSSAITALVPTNLVLEPGSFTALVGPSGCGKSSLLNMVAGFQRPTTGQVLVDDREIAGPVPEVGVVFQQYALFPWFSAGANVEFALKRLRHSSAERKKRAIEALAEVGLAGRYDQYPGQLSGGMKQRVALARTFAASPNVLLMDEPFAALDALTRWNMHELLLNVWSRHRVTVLFVTHDVDEALFLADRVHVMSKGPGRIIETIDISEPRPREMSNRTSSMSANRARILELLRGSHDVAEASNQNSSQHERIVAC